MKKILLGLLLILSPVWAQTSPVAKDPTKGTPKPGARVADNCTPIGRTAKGELVYSLKCDNLPAPPSPPPQAEAPGAPPAAESETRRSGMFGWSFDRRKEGE